MSYVGIYHFVENLKVSDPEGYKDFNFSEGELESVYEYDKLKEKGFSDDRMKEYYFFKTMSIDFYTKDNYIIQFMSHVIETSNKDVNNFNGKLAEDILGLRTAFNQELNSLEQEYGDKLREVYNAVKSRNTELENSYNKEWNEAMDEYKDECQKGNSPDFPSVEIYNPYEDSDYVKSFKESAFLVSIAMRNVLKKLPEYMEDNIKDLSFNLDAAKEYNDSLTYDLMRSYTSMFEKYNDIVNDGTYRILLDEYKEYCDNLELEEYYEVYIANFQYDDCEFVCDKDDYVMSIMNYIRDNHNKHVGNVEEDISGLMDAFNQEINLLEQKYGDKLFEVYHAVKLSNTKIEHSLCKEWRAAIEEYQDEYQKGNDPSFPSVYDYSPDKDSNYVFAFEEGAFLSSIAMRNALDKLPEYMKDNIKNLSFNLDKVKEENNELAYLQVWSHPSMCNKYNAIANDSVYRALLDDYKKRNYDAFETNEHDDVGDDEYDDVGDDAI